MTNERPANPRFSDNPTVWVPRPIEDAEPLSSELRSLSFNPLIAPVLEVDLFDRSIDVDRFAAVLFTSANGVRALANVSDVRSINVFAVGVNTAQEARSLGFTNVFAADGDVEKLAAYVSTHQEKESGPLLHVAGTKRAGDLATLLRNDGFVVEREILYEAKTVDRLPTSVTEALAADRLDAVVLFSPRTARTVCALLTEMPQSNPAKKLTAICMSENVATAIQSISWRKIAVADRSDRASMLQAARQALKPTIDSSIKPDTETETLPELGGTMSDMANVEQTDTIPDAETVIDRFGGIRPMAQKLDIAVSTVQGWKARNHIPENRWQDVKDIAEKEGISLEPASGKSESTTKNDDTVAQNGEEEAEVRTEQADGAPDDVSRDDEPEASTPDVPPQPVQQAPRRPSGTAWVALLIALATAGGVATQSYWRPGVDASLEQHLSQFFGPPPKTTISAPDPTVLEELAALQKRLDTLEATPAPAAESSSSGQDVAAQLAPLLDRLKALEDRATVETQTEPTNIDLSPVTEGIAALRARVDAMDSRADGSLEAFRAELATFADQFDSVRAGIEGVSDRLAALEQRFNQLESASGGPAGAEAAMILAVGHLNDLIVASEPFGGALADISALSPNDATVADVITSLDPMKGSAIATRSELADGFAEIASLIDRAERVGGASDWLGETLAELRSLVSIRRIDSAPEAPAISRAEAAMADNDIAAAVAIVQPFAATDPVIADWVQRATQRVTVDNGLDTLRASALKRLQNAAVGD